MIVCFAMIFGVGCGGVQHDASDTLKPGEPPFGLWSWSVDAPDDTFQLTIERRDGQWQAYLDQESIEVTYHQDEISIERQNGEKFTGELTADQSEIRGYWYQPENTLDYQYVATPVVIPQVTEGRWEDDITVQWRPYRVFLDVFEDENNQPVAVIRNPEGNNIMRSSRFELELEEGGNWALVAGRDENQRRYGLKYTQEGGLLLEYNRFDEPILLEPASDPVGYYSRLRNKSKLAF